jgi:hypothetical protein
MPTEQYASISISRATYHRLRAAVGVLPKLNIRAAAGEAIDLWLKKNAAKIAKRSGELSESAVVNHGGE